MTSVQQVADLALHVTQIGFYLIAGTLAVLTYIAARRALLNTVHTEYHKHVIERLKELSNELLSEFDAESVHYWARGSHVDEQVAKINKMFASHRPEILKSGEFHTGIPEGRDEARLGNLIARVRSDPFVPGRLRDEVVDLLENRLHVVRSVRHEVLRQYVKGLAKGKLVDSLHENQHGLHNKVNSALYERGCGVSQIDEAVQKTRLSIQRHLESFNPLR